MWQGEQATYYIRSTVLGGEVLGGAGQAGRRYVFAGGVKLAELTYRISNGGNTITDAAQFYHTDAAGVSQRVTRNYPETLLGTLTTYPDYIDPRQTELDAAGGNVGTITGYTPQPAPPSDPPRGVEETSNFVNGHIVNATWNGLKISYQVAQNLMHQAGNGGFLGQDTMLLQSGSRFSHYSVRDRFGIDDVYSGTSWDEAVNAAYASEHLTVIRNSVGGSDVMFTFSWLPQQHDRRFTKDEKKDIRNQLSVALGSKLCSDFLNKVLRKLGAKYDGILNVFDAYDNKNAIWDITGAGSDGGAEYPAASKRARLELNLGLHEQRIQRGERPPDELVLTLFHELLHGARRINSFKHPVLARKADEVAQSLGIKLDAKLPGPVDPKLNSTGNEDWRVERDSEILLDHAIKKACGQSK